MILKVMPTSSEHKQPSWSDVAKLKDTESSLLIKGKAGVAVDLKVVK